MTGLDVFDAYGHAVASLSLWAVLVPILGALSTRGRTAEARCDCGKPKRDYNNRWYRTERAFMNAVETSGPFVGATAAAILAGASPFWVNVFASLFILARIAMAYVHIATTIQPLRSVFFVVGMLCTLILALMALVAVF